MIETQPKQLSFSDWLLIDAYGHLHAALEIEEDLLKKNEHYRRFYEKKEEILLFWS